MKQLFRQPIKRTLGTLSRRTPFHTKSAKPVMTETNTVKRGTFAAVTILPGLMPCKAVQAIARGKMLKADAPTFPVPGCDAHKCDCRIARSTDRRDEEGRRSSIGDLVKTGAFGAIKDRRQPADRRGRKKAAQPRAYFNDY